jgi:hypothetical protein
LACSGDEADWLESAAKGRPHEAAACEGEDTSSHVNKSSARAKEMEGLTGESDVLLVPKIVDAEGRDLLHIEKNVPTF